MRQISRGIRGLAMSSFMMLAGCAGLDTGPINTLTLAEPPSSPEYIPDSGDDGSTIVGLAFSGGGMRASAFSYGVLRALDDLVIDESPYRRTMVDNIRMVAGVSGGSVTAGYFALKGRDGYRDFDRRFLYQDPETSMRASVSAANLMRVMHGGANDRTSFGGWLNENLFEGATYATLRQPNAPALWINASDVYNRTPFLFSEDTFAALCSDLASLKLADAVAASASFPVVFAPVALEASRSDCAYKQPRWMQRAIDDPNTSVRLHAYANALDAYRNHPSLNYVKLLDGGLTDNLGITGLVLARASAETPHGPLSAEEAVKLRNLVFIVVDAGRRQTATWGEELRGPAIGPLMQAAIDTNMAAALREGLDALTFAMNDWKAKLVSYRCSLPAETVRRIRGTTRGWNCRDLEVIVEHLAFTDLDQETEDRLNLIPTRLSLPSAEIDLLIEAGRKALNSHPSIMEVVARSRYGAGISGPVTVSALEGRE